MESLCLQGKVFDVGYASRDTYEICGVPKTDVQHQLEVQGAWQVQSTGSMPIHAKTPGRRPAREAQEFQALWQRLGDVATSDFRCAAAAKAPCLQHRCLTFGINQHVPEKSLCRMTKGGEGHGKKKQALSWVRHRFSLSGETKLLLEHLLAILLLLPVPSLSLIPSFTSKRGCGKAKM